MSTSNESNSSTYKPTYSGYYFIGFVVLVFAGLMGWAAYLSSNIQEKSFTHSVPMLIGIALALLLTSLFLLLRPTLLPSKIVVITNQSLQISLRDEVVDSINWNEIAFIRQSLGDELVLSNESRTKKLVAMAPKASWATIFEKIREHSKPLEYPVTFAASKVGLIFFVLLVAATSGLVIVRLLRIFWTDVIQSCGLGHVCLIAIGIFLIPVFLLAASRFLMSITVEKDQLSLNSIFKRTILKLSEIDKINLIEKVDARGRKYIAFEITQKGGKTQSLSFISSRLQLFLALKKSFPAKTYCILN